MQNLSRAMTAIDKCCLVVVLKISGLRSAGPQSRPNLALVYLPTRPLRSRKGCVTMSLEHFDKTVFPHSCTVLRIGAASWALPGSDRSSG